MMHWWNDNERRNRRTRKKKPCPRASLSKINLRWRTLIWDRNPASTVRDRPVTAWPMARFKDENCPKFYLM
jgi:hypothetical protein